MPIIIINFIHVHNTTVENLVTLEIQKNDKNIAHKPRNSK